MWTPIQARANNLSVVCKQKQAEILEQNLVPEFLLCTQARCQIFVVVAYWWVLPNNMGSADQFNTILVCKIKRQTRLYILMVVPCKWTSLKISKFELMQRHAGSSASLAGLTPEKWITRFWALHLHPAISVTLISEVAIRIACLIPKYHRIVVR